MRWLAFLLLFATPAFATVGMQANSTGAVVEDNSVSNFDTCIQQGSTGSQAAIDANTVANCLVGVSPGAAGNSTITNTIDGGGNGVLVAPAPSTTFVKDIAHTVTDRLTLTNGSSTLEINADGTITANGVTRLRFDGPDLILSGSMVGPGVDDIPWPGWPEKNFVTEQHLQSTLGTTSIRPFGYANRVCADSGTCIDLTDKTIFPNPQNTINILGTQGTRVQITTSISSTEPNTVRVSAISETKEAFAYNVDLAGCELISAGLDPTECGGALFPCCTLGQVRDRSEARSKNILGQAVGARGASSCSGDPSVPCAVCSTSDDGSGHQYPCNEDKDCPLNVCAISGDPCANRPNLQESFDVQTGDCDPTVGDYCVVQEHCVQQATWCDTQPTRRCANDTDCPDAGTCKTNTVCSGQQLGSCTGPVISERAKVGAGLYQERFPTNYWRPGFFTVDLQGVAFIYHNLFGTVNNPTASANSLEPNPENCAVDMTNEANFAISHGGVFGGTGVPYCSFGNTFGCSLNDVVLSRINNEGWCYWFGRDGLMRYGGNNMHTNPLVGTGCFSIGASGANGFHFEPAGYGCSQDPDWPCNPANFDADCLGQGTCSLRPNQDWGFIYNAGAGGSPISFDQLGSGGGDAIVLQSRRGGATLNLTLYDTRFQENQSNVATRKSTVVKMRSGECHGHAKDSLNAEICSHNGSTFRITGAGLAGNDNAATGFSQADVSFDIAAGNHVNFRGLPTTYDACTRISYESNAFQYSVANPVFPTAEGFAGGGLNDLGELRCDQPGGVVEPGECWTVASDCAACTPALRGTHRCAAVDGSLYEVPPFHVNMSTGTNQFVYPLSAAPLVHPTTFVGPDSFTRSTLFQAGSQDQWQWRLGELFGTSTSVAPFVVWGPCVMDGNGGPFPITQGSAAQCSVYNETTAGRIDYVMAQVATFTPTRTLTPAISATPSPLPTASPTSTAPTLTPSATPSVSFTPTRTPTALCDGGGATCTPTNTPLSTRTPTSTLTPSPTYTRSPTPSPTVTYTSLPTPNATPVQQCHPNILSSGSPGCQFYGNPVKAVGDPVADTDADNFRSRKTAIAAGFTPTATITQTPTNTAATATPSRTPTGFTADEPLYGDGTILPVQSSTYVFDSTNKCVKTSPTHTASTAIYWNVNAGSNSSTTDLDGGLLLFGTQYGLDLGYNATTSRYRTRLFAASTADICMSVVNANPTAQSGWSDGLCTNSSGNLILGGVASTYNNIATVSNGVPSELAKVDLTAQTAAKTATTLYTPAATGLFRISIYLQVTTAGTTSILGGATGVVIAYTDGDGSVAQSNTAALESPTGTIVTTSATNTTATNLSGTMVIYAKTGVAITYAIGYTSTGTAMQYAAHLKCEAM